MRLRIFWRGNLQLETVIDCELEVGRQRSAEPEPFQRIENGRSRLIIASRKDANISRDHVRLVPDASGGLNVINTSRTCPIVVDPDRELLPGKTCFLAGRAQIHVQQVTMVIEPLGDDSERTISLGTPAQLQNGTLPLPAGLNNRSLIQTLGSSFDAAQTEMLLIWLRLIASLFHHSGNPARFATESVNALERILGTDAAVVLRWQPSDGTQANEWSIIACHDVDGWSPRPDLLTRMSQLKQSILSETDDRTTIVTPVFNSAGEVTGAVAGLIRTSQLPDSIPVSLQVGLLELIASGLRPNES